MPGVLSYYGHIPQLQSLAMAMKMTLTTSSCHSPQVLQEPVVVGQLVRLLSTSPVGTVREQCARLLAHFREEIVQVSTTTE